MRCTTLAAAFLAGALENTLVIAPREGGGCQDSLATNEIRLALQHLAGRRRRTRTSHRSTSSARAPGYVVDASPNAQPFRAFNDARNCTTYDLWPFGFRKRSGYSAAQSDDQLRKQLAARRTIYLLGGLDILPLAGFD